VGAWLEGYRLLDVVGQYFADPRPETPRSNEATREIVVAQRPSEHREASAGDTPSLLIRSQ